MPCSLIAMKKTLPIKVPIRFLKPFPNHAKVNDLQLSVQLSIQYLLQIKFASVYFFLSLFESNTVFLRNFEVNKYKFSQANYYQQIRVKVHKTSNILYYHFYQLNLTFRCKLTIVHLLSYSLTRLYSKPTNIFTKFERIPKSCVRSRDASRRTPRCLVKPQRLDPVISQSTESVALRLPTRRHVPTPRARLCHEIKHDHNVYNYVHQRTFTYLVCYFGFNFFFCVFFCIFNVFNLIELKIEKILP